MIHTTLSPCEPITIITLPARPTHPTRMSQTDIMQLSTADPAVGDQELLNIRDKGHHHTIDKMNAALQVETSC